MKDPATEMYRVRADTLSTEAGAGHTSNLENPGPVNDAIRTFLEDVE